IELNEKGQVVKINYEEDGEITGEITFEYGDFSRSTKFNAVMRYRNWYEGDFDIYLQLDEHGFVTYALEINLPERPEDRHRDWEFEYNSDGQMTRMRIYTHDDDGDEFRINYKNGDITNVAEIIAGETEYNYIINYTNSKFSEPVPNKGGIMLLDEAFEIYITEMEPAYWAGMLGKATKNLPMGITYDYDDYEEYYWEFNSNQLPIKFYDSKECLEDNRPDVVFHWR
ncbi:MAG: DUF4595 domain-containing protein, partial [Paramuribaculum sp.]|nr:DUF4595 domain-containing protein [Paramuribaculum sp.]